LLKLLLEEGLLYHTVSAFLRNGSRVCPFARTFRFGTIRLRQKLLRIQWGEMQLFPGNEIFQIPGLLAITTGHPHHGIALASDVPGVCFGNIPAGQDHDRRQAHHPDLRIYGPLLCILLADVP